MDNAPPPSDRSASWPERGVSILNGMVGDYLQRRGNELAISMSFRHRGRPLRMDEPSLRSAHPALSRKICVLVHGLCCNESVWDFPAQPGARGSDSYGARLQRDCGNTPFAVRYNTGLSIAENGNQLAALLDHLFAAYPLPVDEITLIGHSMGGLVMRSACDPACTGERDWLPKVTRMIYLGTPHDGADLERFAHFASGALRAWPSLVTRLVGDTLDLRGRGTKDLRRGLPRSGRDSLPMLPSARHHLLMGTLTRNPRHPVGRIFGDALVRVPRATTDHGSEGPSPEVVVFPGVHHLALAHDPAVYRHIRKICGGRTRGDR
jgi:pimeloyl-ACP methyl ester carboxylesterase